MLDGECNDVENNGDDEDASHEASQEASDDRRAPRRGRAKGDGLMDEQEVFSFCFFCCCCLLDVKVMDRKECRRSGCFGDTRC